MCMLGFLITGVNMQPLEFQVDGAEDVKDLLLDLFLEEIREGRNLEEESKDENIIQDEKEEEKESADTTAEVNPDQVAKYNNYMDAVFRRMNAALRAKLMDPMELNLNHKVKKDSAEKQNEGNKVNQRSKRETIDLEELNDSEDLVDRKGISTKVNERKAKTKDIKNKKNIKHRKKDVNKKKKGEKQHKNKGGNKGKDQKLKAKTKAERKKVREEKREEKRRKKKEKNGRNIGELSREKRTKQSKEKHEKNMKKKNKKDGEEGKAVGSLSGIATMRRSGDVTVLEDDSHTLVTSLFTVGPLRLEVTKSLGHGKARTVKTAKATTDLMTGVMVLKVKPDGSAHVKKVVFKKPEHVAVSGSIAEKKERSENMLKNSFNRSRPLAAQRILKTARYVLKGSAKAS